MLTISDEEFKKRYGQSALDQLKQKPADQGFSSRVKQGYQGFSSRVKQGFSGGINKISSAGSDINSGNPIRFVEGSLKAGAGAVEAAFSPLTAAVQPVVEPTIGRAVNAVANKISDNPNVQKFSISQIGELTARITEDLNNLNTIVGAIAGLKGTGGAVRGASRAIGESASEAIERAGQSVTNIGKKLDQLTPSIGTVAKEVTPTYKSIINDQVIKAFDLTQGDVARISKSTGHNIGEFVSKNNLIGNTVEASKQLIDDFYKQNYQTVRAEIGKVKTRYNANEVPRYTEALTELQKQIQGVPGLQAQSAEVRALLKKQNPSLADVQRVKELMDDHFRLYNAAGDVQTGIAKQGLDIIRKDIRSFIEDEVKKNSGVDIFELNNNVATSRSLLDAIQARSGRASTRQKISLGDLGWFGGGSVIGTPLFGLAAVFAKKVIESPTVRLRIAKYINSLEKVKQNKIKSQLQSGKIPVELRRFVKIKNPK
jgi:hypothetical protein